MDYDKKTVHAELQDVKISDFAVGAAAVSTVAVAAAYVSHACSKTCLFIYLSAI